MRMGGRCLMLRSSSMRQESGCEPILTGCTLAGSVFSCWIPGARKFQSTVLKISTRQRISGRASSKARLRFKANRSGWGNRLPPVTRSNQRAHSVQAFADGSDRNQVRFPLRESRLGEKCRRLEQSRESSLGTHRAKQAISYDQAHTGCRPVFCDHSLVRRCETHADRESFIFAHELQGEPGGMQRPFLQNRDPRSCSFRTGNVGSVQKSLAEFLGIQRRCGLISQ